MCGISMYRCQRAIRVAEQREARRHIVKGGEVVDERRGNIEPVILTRRLRFDVPAPARSVWSDENVPGRKGRHRARDLLSLRACATSAMQTDDDGQWRSSVRSVGHDGDEVATAECVCAGSERRGAGAIGEIREHHEQLEQTCDELSVGEGVRYRCLGMLHVGESHCHLLMIPRMTPVVQGIAQLYELCRSL